MALNFDNDKDFHINNPEDENLFDPIPGTTDEEFDEEMYNYGDEDDLPDSDRETEEKGGFRNPDEYNPL